MAAKKTFTYATEPGIKEKASKKAKRERLTLSEKIDQMLREYIKPIPRLKGGIDLPDEYLNFTKIGIMKPDGTIEELGKVPRSKK